MGSGARIHFGRVLLAGILAELGVFAIVFPVGHFPWPARFSCVNSDCVGTDAISICDLGGAAHRIAVRASRSAGRADRGPFLHGLDIGAGPDTAASLQNRTRSKGRGRSLRRTCGIPPKND